MYSTDVKDKKSKSSNLNILLSPLWDSTGAGYISVDFHVHLNSDGHQSAKHDGAFLLMRREDLNTLATMSWNHWERRINSKIIGKLSI
jgi:TolB protein